MHRKPRTATTARRAIAVGALALPLSVVGAGLAHAGDHERDHDRDRDHLTAVQDGGLADLGVGVDPQLNVGGILNDGPVLQQNSRSDSSNEGILQSGGDEFDAFQAGDLVDATLEADPQLNVGGILSGGGVQQGNADHDSSNSGIVQD